MSVGGPWDAPQRANPDATPWWGIYPPYQTYNGYTCGGCGMWVMAGQGHTCRSFTPNPPPAQAGYTCPVCSSFVIYGAVHTCTIASPNTTPLFPSAWFAETPAEETNRLLRRLVELLEGQQSTGSVQSSDWTAEEFTEDGVVRYTWEDGAWVLVTHVDDDDEFDVINGVDMRYTAKDVEDDAKTDPDHIGRWSVWGLDASTYPHIGDEWLDDEHYATLDVDDVRYYFVSPPAAIRAYRQPGYPTFASSPGLVMVKRLHPNDVD